MYNNIASKRVRSFRRPLTWLLRDMQWHSYSEIEEHLKGLISDEEALRRLGRCEKPLRSRLNTLTDRLAYGRELVIRNMFWEMKREGRLEIRYEGTVGIQGKVVGKVKLLIAPDRYGRFPSKQAPRPCLRIAEGTQP